MNFTIPIRTPSCANLREHWHARAKRAKGHRLAACACFPRDRVPSFPVVVTLTRVAPRPLDDDNLRGALKAVRDGIADALGVDDRDERVRWRYRQIRGAAKYHAVDVSIAEVRKLPPVDDFAPLEAGT